MKNKSMSKKQDMFIILLILLFAMAAYFYSNSAAKVDCENYVLNGAHKITDEAGKPKGTWLNMTSPRGSRLEIIELIEPQKDCQDCAWRRAMYSEEENRFWIADMPGESMAWYGPFEGKPCQ